MTAADTARDAAWLEQTQSRRPLPPKASAADRRAWQSIADDANPDTIRARRAALLDALKETP